MILWKWSPKVDKSSIWHRKFIWWPTWVQTEGDFHNCRSGTALVWLHFVWRQNIACSSDSKLWRYVLSDKPPQ